MLPFKPTKAQLAAAEGTSLSDLIAPRLRVLFVGINPGLYSGAVGHHFARPGNRFWPALHASGFTPDILSPFDERRMLKWNLGITNIVRRATATADQLRPDELVQGAGRIKRKLRRYQPRFAAFLGLGAYRTAFVFPKATLGLQPWTVGQTKIWLLPNPSGLNAHHQPADLARLFGELRDAL